MKSSTSLRSEKLYSRKSSASSDNTTTSKSKRESNFAARLAEFESRPPIVDVAEVSKEECDELAQKLVRTLNIIYYAHSDATKKRLYEIHQNRKRREQQAKNLSDHLDMQQVDEQEQMEQQYLEQQIQHEEQQQQQSNAPLLFCDSDEE